MVIFGFPGSPDIPFHQRNVGFLDQQKALNWVNQNIRAFGGDPSKVTIFGESSGGYAVKQLLINPPSPPQFRAAIMQSQAFGAASDNEKSWTILAKELGCNNTSSGLSEMDCLKVAPAKLIISVLDSNGIGFMPIVDNTTNGPSFDDALTQELVANVPILIGTNADEGTVLTSVLPPPEVMLDGIFGNDTASKSLARSIYPLNVTSNELKSRILTDHTYTCTTSAIAISTAHSGQRAWRYFFNASFANNQPLPGAGAWHTSEIPIVFGTYRRDNQTTVEQVQLSRSMQQAWGNFAKDPENGPGWARVGTSAQDLRLFDTSGAVCGRSIDADVVDGVCAYYDSAILAGCL
ncbi:hypothetical protein QQX98_003207 [Neonectria punicea]|uniref:Carboxylic ester hydrolase n=1 Tax=Neonectria punicea TaxID=979145 RepID=A0ABR1HEP5_9HYPO